MKKTAQFCPGCGASAVPESMPSPGKKHGVDLAKPSGRKWIIAGAMAILVLVVVVYFFVLPTIPTPVSGLSSNPEVRVLNDQAWALNGQKKFQDAFTAADKSAGIDPMSADAWANKGWALAGLGKYDEALTVLDKAITLDPDNAITWSNKGFSLLNLGRCTDAVSSFDKAIALDPYDYGAKKYRKMALENCPVRP